MKNASKVLVVGATGYIGGSLFINAKKLGGVVGTSSFGESGFLSLRLDQAEYFDYNLIKLGDTVLLSAAISSPDMCAREYGRAREVNVVGTSKFIQSAIKRGARVIFFSSDAVYGEQKNDFDERIGCNPVGEYAEMKREVEQCFLGNASFKSIRLSYVFSRQDKFSRYLAACAERNVEAELFHPFFRAIVHRDDVVEGVLKLATCWENFPDEVINFGGPQVLSRVEFAECFREVNHLDLRFKVSEPDANFFSSRPRVIAMKSPVFERLLERPPRTLVEATRLEFE